VADTVMLVLQGAVLILIALSIYEHRKEAKRRNRVLDERLARLDALLRDLEADRG
jgi:hypothetical protein